MQLVIPKTALLSSLLTGELLFFINESLASSAHSVDIKPQVVLNIPYRTSFVLHSQYHREVAIYAGDNPNSKNCIKHFSIPHVCPSGYAITISGSLSAGGGTRGSQTNNSVQGFGLKYLDINSKESKSVIGYCAYTFYGKRQGNAHKAWLSYTVYCNGKEAAGSARA
jgi:hypothetical protein